MWGFFIIFARIIVKWQMRRTLYLVLIALSVCLGLKGQTEGGGIVASLLTCSPGTEVYSLSGHTGLRMKDTRKNLDLVFNYGVFDFRRPHFVWYFMLGECDYEVCPIPSDIFMQEYERRGSSVTEQRLNLTPGEAERLMSQLVLNCQPENRVYRYNFLTNNCTTKARDQIEQAVDGTVVYEEAGEHPTYRTLLHRYTEANPWVEAGCDLLLGAACDTVLSDRAAQFLPEQLMAYFGQAQIFDSLNNRRPLVAETVTLIRENKSRQSALVAEASKGTDQIPFVGPWASSLPTPLVLSVAVLGVCLLVLLLEYLCRRMFWGFDIVVMTLQGLVGGFLCFMFLCSEHPTLDSNWQIVAFNPLPLLCIPWVVRCAVRRKVCLYHYVAFLWLVLFLVFMPWLPQTFSVLTLPLALALLTRPMSYLLYYNRKDSKVLKDPKEPSNKKSKK